MKKNDPSLSVSPSMKECFYKDVEEVELSTLRDSILGKYRKDMSMLHKVICLAAVISIVIVAATLTNVAEADSIYIYLKRITLIAVYCFLFVISPNINIADKNKNNWSYIFLPIVLLLSSVSLVPLHPQDNSHSVEKYWIFIAITCFLLLQLFFIRYSCRHKDNPFYTIWRRWRTPFGASIVLGLSTIFLIFTLKKNHDEYISYVLPIFLLLIKISTVLGIRRRSSENSLVRVIMYSILGLIAIGESAYCASYCLLPDSSSWVVIVEYYALLGLTFALCVIMPDEIRREINRLSKQDLMFWPIYWIQLIKSLVFYNIAFALSAFWVTCSTVVAVYLYSIIGDVNATESSPYNVWIANPDGLGAFFGAYSIIIISLIYCYRDHHRSFRRYSTRVVMDNLLNEIKDHMIIVGTKSLGRLVLKSVFKDIHLCRRGINNSYFSNKDIGAHFYRVKNRPAFDILIDDNFHLHLISNRVIVIDEKNTRFKWFSEQSSDYAIGFYSPWKSENTVYFVGICGDIMHPAIQAASRFQYASMINSTSHEYQTALTLAKSIHPKKKILSVIDTPVFDTITANTYSRSTFLINPELVEGVSVSQRIIVWFMQYLYNINKLHNNRYSLDVYYDCLPNILLIGSGKILFYIVQSLTLSLLSMGISYRDARIIIQRCLTVFTKECLFHDEFKPSSLTDYLCGFQVWEFYPIRNLDLSLGVDSFKIPVYIQDNENFENYADALCKLNNRAEDRYPHLSVIVDHNPENAPEIVNRAINAFQIVERVNQRPRPSIISSVNHIDRELVNEQLMKYFVASNPSNLYNGFPSPLPIEANFTRDSVAANQNASIVRALYTNTEDYLRPWILRSETDESLETNSDLVAETTFCLKDVAGALCFLLNDLHGFKINLAEYKKDHLRPSFSFCYSFKERHFPETFVFTSTAYLESLNLEESKEYTYLNSYYINCDQNGREKFIKAFDGAFNTKKETLDLNTCPNSKLSDCTISTFVMHKQIPSISEERLKVFDNSNINNDVRKNDIPERVHLKIWSDGDEVPGSLCQSLNDVMMLKLKRDENSQLIQNFIQPYIEFTTSMPCGFPKDYHTGLAKKTLIMRLWDSNKYENESKETKKRCKSNSIIDRLEIRKKYINANGTIIGVKIKKGGGLGTINGQHLEFNDKDNWFQYTIGLMKFLNEDALIPHDSSEQNSLLPSICCQPIIGIAGDQPKRYRAFVIVKTLEGGNFNKKDCTGLNDISDYYEISEDKEPQYRFRIVKDLLNEYRSGCIDRLHPVEPQNADISSQYANRNHYQIQIDESPVYAKDTIGAIYEIVLIRTDILKYSVLKHKDECNNDIELKLNNRLFFFDDL